MSAMHDHIAQTFPDLCAMSHKAAEAPAPEVVPDVTKAAQPKGEWGTPEPAPDQAPSVVKAALGDTGSMAPDLVKAFGEQDRQFGELRELLEKSRRDTQELQARIEEMSAMPDPRQAPFKGVMAGYPPARTQAEPVSAVTKAANTAQSTLLHDLRTTWLTDPDPAARENAYQAITRMLGVPGGGP